jgi:glycosyltransferase involved in cell wall biosynthesis
MPAVSGTPPLTLGIDARAAAEVPAGRGRVVRELLAALAARDDPHSYRLYCHRPDGEAGLDERFDWCEIDLPGPLWHAATARRASRECDAFLSTNSYLTVWALRTPAAVLVHDLIAFLPEMRPQRRAALIERVTLRPAVRRAAAVLCNSEATRRDLVARLPGAADKASIVHFAAHPRFGRERSPEELAAVRERLGLPEAFVLSVGTLEPRKNLARLVEAHGRLDAALREAYPLLLVGPKGWEIDELLDQVAAGPDNVRVPGFVEDEDLAALYQLCTVFCYPSLYEGFGLPVLEAIAAGAPTITSSVSSLPEVGGDAVVYVDPRDREQIGAAMAGLLAAPERRAELARRGRERAAGYSWDRAAGETLAVLERISRS